MALIIAFHICAVEDIWDLSHAFIDQTSNHLAVFEHEAPFVLEHGQVVGRLVYEGMTEVPNVLYGADMKSNYQGQGLKLSKHFAAP